MLYGLFLLGLALVPRLVGAQEFVEPPPADGTSTSAPTSNYTLNQAAPVSWDCNYTNLDLLLVSEYRAGSGRHLAPAWNATLLANTTASNASVHFPSTAPLDHGAGFHLLAVEIDPDSGNATGNSFASAAFDLRAAPAATTTLPPSWPSTTTTGSASASATAGSPPSASVVGISLGLILGVGALAAAITTGIWVHNRRRHQRYAALIAGPNEAGIAVDSPGAAHAGSPLAPAPMAMAMAASPRSAPVRASAPAALAPRRNPNKPLPLILAPAATAPIAPRRASGPARLARASPSVNPAPSAAAYPALRRASATHRRSPSVSPLSSARRSAAPSAVSPLSSRRPSGLSSHPPPSSRYSVRSSASFEDMRPPTPPPKTWTPLGRRA